MMRRALTWKDLKERGHPYTRQHTGRLERQGRFPQRRKHGNRVVWMEDEYVAWFDLTFQPVAPLTD